jgi:CRP/FNR family transcriptional regulator, cyclic AMP receptor protein
VKVIPGQPIQRTTVDATKGRVQRAIKVCSLFDGASRATREAAMNAADLDVIPGGGTIAEQGAAALALLIIGRGRARLERATPDGRSIPLGYRGSGDVMGESCLTRQPTHAETATAMEETEIVRIPHTLINDFMHDDPGVAPAVFSLLVQRTRETEDRIESLLFRNVEGRVVEFLLKAADRWGVPNPKGTLISAPITHLEIAQAIGSTRETVTLTLGALRKEGLLDVTGRRLIVKSREGLAQKP